MGSGCESIGHGCGKVGLLLFEMSTSRHLPWRSAPSADLPKPVAQPNDHNNLRRPGTPPRVSPDRAAPGQSRGHNIMTEGLPSKPIPSSWQAWRSFASLRETRITNHAPASHKHRQTITAKESTTSPRAPRPARPRRVTLAIVAATPTAPDNLSTMQAIPKPTRGAQSAGDGLGRIVSTTPLSPPVHRTRTSPTLRWGTPTPCLQPSIHYALRPTSGLGQRPTHRTNPNLPRLAESAIFHHPAPKPPNKPNSKRALRMPRHLPAARVALRADAATIQTAIQSQFQPRLPLSHVGLRTRVTTKTKRTRFQPAVTLQNIASQGGARLQPCRVPSPRDAGPLVSTRLQYRANPIRRQDAKSDVLIDPPRDLARRAHAKAIAIDEQLHHQPRMVRGLAARLGFVIAFDRPQIQFVDKLADEAGGVIVGEPVAQVRRRPRRLFGQVTAVGLGRTSLSLVLVL